MKIVKTVVVTLILIFLLFKILNWTGVFNFMNIGNSSNEPSLKSKNNIFVTNLIKPKKLDFVIYDPNNIKASGIWVHRLCGLENDTVQIKNGVLFVNNENIDRELNLKRSYKIDKNEFQQIKEKLNFNKSDLYKTPDSIIIQLTEKESSKSKKIKRFTSQIIDEEIYKIYLKKWNKDNFGPLIIPKGYTFILGDNRDFCIDSRFLGLIPVENIKGTVIIK